MVISLPDQGHPRTALRAGQRKQRAPRRKARRRRRRAAAAERNQTTLAQAAIHSEDCRSPPRPRCSLALAPTLVGTIAQAPVPTTCHRALPLRLPGPRLRCCLNTLRHLLRFQPPRAISARLLLRVWIRFARARPCGLTAFSTTATRAGERKRTTMCLMCWWRSSTCWSRCSGRKRMIACRLQLLQQAMAQP